MEVIVTPASGTGFNVSVNVVDPDLAELASEAQASADSAASSAAEAEEAVTEIEGKLVNYTEKTLFGSETNEAYTESFEESEYLSESNEIYPKEDADIEYSTSTFSGWSTPIGTPQNFDSITFQVKARSNPITQIRFRVRVGSTGSTLADKTISLNIDSNQLMELTVKFDEIITNENLDKLHFSYQCNQFCDTFGELNTVLFPESSGYDVSRYFTSGDISTINGTISTGRLINWVIISLSKKLVAFKSALIDWLYSRLPQTEGITPSAVLLLPSQLYATQGVELNVYWDNIIFTNLPLSSFRVDVVSTRGKQIQRGWTYTPSTEVSTSYISISVYFEEKLIVSKSSFIRIQNSAGAVGSKKVLCIGDSTTAGGQYISLINSEYGVNPSLTFLGTQGTGLNKHEGYAGYSFSSFVGSSGNPFWISGSLNFAQYLINNSYTLSASDLISIHLGINDVFSNGTPENIDDVISNANALISNIRSAVPGINIVICITIPPTISQDGFGENYNNGYDLKNYLENYKKLVTALLSEFDTPAKRTAKTWICPFNVSIDRTYNFPQSQVNANSRNTTQVTKWTNGVHPATSGYNQMGDALWSFIKNLS